MFHRCWDYTEEPTPRVQALLVEIPYDLTAFTIDASGT